MSDQVDKPWLDVCAAVIRRGNSVLLTSRPPGSHLAGYWEFPGGKIDVGESLASCIVREIREELRLDVVPGRVLTTVRHEYPEKRIRLHCIECRVLPDAAPNPAEGQQSRWVSISELVTHELAPADREAAHRLCPAESGPGNSRPVNAANKTVQSRQEQ